MTKSFDDFKQTIDQNEIELIQAKFMKFALQHSSNLDEQATTINVSTYISVQMSLYFLEKYHLWLSESLV